VTRRVLHIIRTERGRSLCNPSELDRVVDLADLAPAELVTLAFEYDAVVVW